jgi:hypothetical protein
MSLVTIASSAPASYQAVPRENPDVDFERRWSDWKARGLAHDRAIRRRVRVVALVTAVIAVAVLVAYGLLSS